MSEEGFKPGGRGVIVFTDLIIVRRCLVGAADGEVGRRRGKIGKVAIRAPPISNFSRSIVARG